MTIQNIHYFLFLYPEYILFQIGGEICSILFQIGGEINPLAGAGM